MRNALEAWRGWHASRGAGRVAVKLLIFHVILIPVLFPRVWLLPTWLSRWRDPNAVLQPDLPALAPLETSLRASLAAKPALSEQDVFTRAHDLVRQRLPYDFDWNVWGEFDWLPTVEEALDAGREDCDGVAVVTASLLRRMGYDAQLVCDFLHVWLRGTNAQAGSLGGTPSIVATPTGSTLRIGRVTANLIRGTGFGVSAFPLAREVVLLTVVLLLTLHPRVSRRRAAIAFVLMIAAFLALRASHQRTPIPYVATAFVIFALGWLLLAWRARRAGGPPSERPAPAAGAPT